MYDPMQGRGVAHYGGMTKETLGVQMSTPEGVNLLYSSEIIQCSWSHFSKS